MRRAIRKASTGLVAVALVALLSLGGAALMQVGHAEGGVTSTNLTPAVRADVSVVAHDKAAEKLAWRKSQLKAKLTRKTIPDGLYNIGSASQPSLSISIESDSKANGARTVSAARENSNWAQKWAIAWDAKTGYYKIRNFNSRKYLSVAGAIKAGAATRQVGAVNSAAQLWEPVRTSGGIAFKSAGSNLALATVAKNGSVAFRLRKIGTKTPVAQKFILRSVDPIEADFTYFVNNLSTGKRLHIAGNSKDNGAALDLAAAAGAKSQKFRLIKSGSAYRLQNIGSCYYLGANARGVGSAVQLASTLGNQSRWQVRFNPRTVAFSVVSVISGRCLDATSDNLTLKDEVLASPQLFTFTRTHAFKVYLNPGHGWNSNGNGIWDPGAVGSGYQEASFSHDLAHRVENCLAGSDVQVVNGEQFVLPYWKRLPKAASLGCDAIVSIHFDAGGGSGTLKMVGTRGRAQGSYELAEAVHSGVVSNLRLPDRGTSWRGDITCVNGSIPSMLTEICYMDNWNDVQTYLGRRDAVARGIADGIMKASRTRAVVVATASKSVRSSGGISIAKAKTTRNVVWSGARSISFASVTVGKKALKVKRDFTLGCYSDFKRYSVSEYELNESGQVVKRVEVMKPIVSSEITSGEASDEPSGTAAVESSGNATESSTVELSFEVVNPNPVIYRDGSYYYVGKKAKSLSAGVSYVAVLLGKGAYNGMHTFEFVPHKSLKTANLRRESSYYKYTGKAIVPNYFVGSPAANDRELMSASNCRRSISRHLFGRSTPVKRAINYSNYRYYESYSCKVTGKGGRLKGSRSFTFRVYRPTNIGKCVMTQTVPLTRVGNAADFSLWYPRPNGSGDYVPSFLYKVQYVNSKGKKTDLPKKAGTYTLVVTGNADYGCKGVQRRKVQFSKSSCDIGSGSLAVKVIEAPSRENGYKPFFKVVNRDTGRVLNNANYGCYYIDNLDQRVPDLRSAGAIVVVGKGSYTGHLVYYIGQSS